MTILGGFITTRQYLNKKEIHQKCIFFLNSQAADYLNILKVWIMATQNILQSISIGKDCVFREKVKQTFSQN